MARTPEQKILFETKLPPGLFRDTEGKIIDAEGNEYDENGNEAPSEELKQAEEMVLRLHSGLSKDDPMFKEWRKIYLAQAKKEGRLREQAERKRKRQEKKRG